MPSPIAGETSVDEREAAGLIGASRKKRKRKRADSSCSGGSTTNDCGIMSPEEDSTASPPAGLIAGRDESNVQQRLTSPPSGSKFVHEMARDDFGETCLEESTIIKNREDDDEGTSEEEEEASENVTLNKEESGTSDVENFDGKIVYNPDGSAYIIEDSELSDEDAVELPQLMGNGCIVDGRGVNVSRSEGFPQIANAIYVSSRNQSLHHALYGNVANFTKGLQDKSVVPEVPVMHSYRVYSVRDNKYSERGSGGPLDKREEGENVSSKDCSSVPVKPILMCFICKLSFGYAKSFVAHAMSDHNVMLQEDEKDILSHKNTSAIIQCVGKEKEPLVSFLEPLSPMVAPSLDGKYRPTSGHSASSTYASSTQQPKVPNTPMARNSIGTADGNGSSDYNDDKNGAESLVMHRRDRSPIYNSQNQHVPEVSASLSGSGSSRNNDFNNNSNNNTSNNSSNSCSSGSGGGSPNVVTSGANGGRGQSGGLNCVMDLTRKSPISGSASNNGAITSPGASPSPGSTVSPLLSSSMSFPQHPPNFLTGTTIGVCPDHMGGRPSGVDCSKCELILSSSRLSGVGGGPLAGMHSRNSCKTLKCPKCNWHYKYQETLEIHMKEKHPETETSCIYCIAGQPHPRLARGETYTCGYKPYRCEVCNYSTTTKGNLSIHMQSDKHLNNMQELQNGTVSNSDLSSHQQSTPPSVVASQQHGKPTGMTSPSAGGNGLPYHSTISSSQAQKPKPTFRCDVCNYETNVARNLRIHMTSEKHTHNMMVLQQNMKQMQALSAIQPSQHQQQLNFEQLLHFHPGLTLPGEKPPPHSEAALADMAYNQALIIQLMTGGQLPPHMSPELAPNLDMGLNPETMEPPPEPADPNPENLFQCCVCNVFNTDSLEALSHHLAADRTKIREQEILAIVAGHYVCKLCTYKTTLKANFQLHCKTDKHLQRLQHVNHVKEGGIRNEWKLKYVSSPGGVQVRCNACDYYTNSTHKLQLHAAAQRHEFSAALFRHLRDNYDDATSRIYQCVLCEFTCTDKLPLFQHIRSMQHLKIEQIHQLHRRSAGKDAQIDFNEMFKVIPHPSDTVSESDYCNQSQCSSNTNANVKPSQQTTPPSHRFSPSSSTASSSGSKDMDNKCTQSDSSKADVDEQEEPSDNFESEGIRCTTCNKMFRNSEELCLHQNENGHFDIKQIEGSVFLCPKKECSAYFTTVLNVQRHYLDVHIQQNRVTTVAVSEKHVYKYRCSQCSLAFKTMEKLQLHSQYHFIRDATKCVLCGRSFRSIISLQKHVEMQHANLSEEEMSIFKQSLLSNPLLLAGLNQTLDPSITELLKKESWRMDTDESMDEDGPNKETEDGSMNVGGTENSDEDEETSKEQFIEDYINSQAIAEKNYEDPNRKYKCHKCKMAFTRQSYLTLHNKKVPHRKGEKVIYPLEKYLDPKRPYKCEICKESFTQKNILTVHCNSVCHLHKLKKELQNSSSGNAMAGSSNVAIAGTSGNVTVPGNSNVVAASTSGNLANVNATGTNLMISPTSIYGKMKARPTSQTVQGGDEKMDTSTATSAATSPVTSSAPSHHGMYSCQRCSALFGNQEQLHTHQQLYCMFGTPMTMFPSLATTPTTTSMQFSQSSEMKTPPPSLLAADEAFMKLPQQAKKSSHMYKHLLESFGFDLVMQFNENHQRRQRKEREESERLLAELQSSAQFLSEESQTMDARKDSVSDSVREEKDDAPSSDELPEVSKSTCAHCNKEFSSVWVLKAHCEEVHKDLVPLDFLEKYAQQIKCEIEKKVVPTSMANAMSNSMASTNDNESTATCSKASGTSDIDSTITTSASINVPVTTTADVGTDTYSSSRDDQYMSDENSALNMSTNAMTDTSTLTYDDNSEKENDDKDQPKITSQTVNEPSATPNPPTACSTPGSSTDSISPNGGSGNAQSNNPSPNISMSLAQQMNEMQAALNAMAASQLQQQLQQFNPMMMGMASLGMGLPLGLNMPALAAMNLQPPLVPMMMPPPSFDPIVGLGQAQNQLFSQQAANMDTSSILAKQQQHLMQQQQVANASQQKRARTRITDDQLKILRAHFDINNSPSEEQINKMAAESGLPPKVIKHWFRNTLFKERQRNKDSPYNFNNPPSTTLNLEEYEKTGEAKVIPLTSGGSGDESNVQNNNVDSSIPKMNMTNAPRKTSTPSIPKTDQMSPHFPNHSIQQQSFPAPRSVASSPVLIKTEPKDAECSSDNSQMHHKINNVLPDAESRVKKEEFEDVKPNLYMHEQAHSPPSPNISERLSSVPTPCSSPENLTVSSVFNSQHLSSEMTATSSSMLNASMHSGSNMLPPKLNQNFSTSTPSLANPNFGPVSNRSLSPGRSNSVDCFTHGILSSGNSNGSNSSGGSSGKRANRTRFTDYQIKVLQEFFENNAYPKDDDLEYLSKLLSLSPRVIVVWFQNARQKARKVYENQPPVEPVSGIDENTGRFQRTPGLNYQCKKCLLVFQRYYELIRHQKTHCFKEEDAKRSAQAQAAAAQMAAVLSSEDSNSSTIIEQNQQCSVTNSNPSTPAAPVTPTPSSAYPASPVSHNPSTPESKENTLQCENCNLVFPRFELWREHQLIHIMNPNLFPNYPPESPFGILQQQAQQQQQQQSQQSQTTPQQSQQQSHESFNATNATVAAAAAEITATTNSNPPSPHPLLAMFNTNKRKYEEYVYLSDRDSDQPKDKRLRTTILPEQLDYLYQKYQIESNPSRKMLENIANEVGLKKRVVQVWFQNTRARERKGQFRAHSQVINKRCPFCPALFKVKTALESHLTTKHTDQCSRGEINIDALPDEEVSHDSTSFLSAPPNAVVSAASGGDQQNAKFANFGAANSMIHPLFASMQAAAGQGGDNDAQIKKYYEDALRRYLSEIQSQQQHIPNGSLDKENFPADFSAKMKNSEANDDEPTETTGESPLDLSKPVDLSNPIKFPVRADDRSILSNGPLTDMNDRSMCEDEYSESECSENMEDESPPASPASNRRIWSADNAGSRQDEEWSSDDERAMKAKFMKAQQFTLQSIMEAIGDISGGTVDSSVVVNKSELNGQQIPLACAHKELELGYVCKRCKLVFPNEPAVRGHQSKTGCGGVLAIKQYVYACKMCQDSYQFNSIGDLQRHFDMKHPTAARCASPLADEMENVVNQITALAAAKAAAQNSEDSNGNLFCQPGDVAKKSKLFAAAVAAAAHSQDGQDPNGNLFCQPADVAKKSKLFAIPNSIAAPTGGH